MDPAKPHCRSENAHWAPACPAPTMTTRAMPISERSARLRMQSDDAGTPAAAASGRRDVDHHAGVTLHKGVRQALGLLENLDAVEALHDLLPQNAKLEI